MRNYPFSYVYTDTLISTIVDLCKLAVFLGVYTDTLISTIVDIKNMFTNNDTSIQTL